MQALVEARAEAARERAIKWPRFKDKTDRRLNLDVQPSVLTAFRRPEV